MLALTLAGSVIAGLVQGLSGSFFAVTALAFWAWVLPPHLAGPMAVFGSLLGQLLAMRVLWRGFSWKLVAPFIAGGVVGVPLGVMLLPYIDQLTFKAGLGAFLMLWCPVMLLSAELPPIVFGGRLLDVAICWIGGICGGLSGLAGALPTLWCVLRRWERDQQRAVMQAFNLTMHVVTISIYGGRGLISAESLHMFWVMTPAVVVAVLAGIWLYGRISAVQFRRMVLVLLSGAGIALLAASLPKLI